MEQVIDVSSNIIFRVLGIILGLWFLYVIRDVIWLFLIAIIITAALNPMIKNAQVFLRSPRAVAVGGVYLVFFLLLAILISFIVPTISQQFEQIGTELPTLLAQFLPQHLSPTEDPTMTNVSQKFIGLLGNPFSTTVGLLSGLISIFAVISMSFYMSLQEDGLKNALLLIVPSQHQKYIATLIDRIQDNFGRWMAGQLIIMIFVGVMYYIALSSLGVPYAPLLAIFGGLLEIVPYFGPILAGIPAVIFGVMQDPMVGFLVFLAYLLINMIENYFLVPKIMNKAIGLHPVLVILALLIGGQIAGIVGIFLAVPLAGALGLFLRDVMEKRIN
jgi:predicted PurR-regulated permease PerM